MTLKVYLALKDNIHRPCMRALFVGNIFIVELKSFLNIKMLKSKCTYLFVSVYVKRKKTTTSHVLLCKFVDLIGAIMTELSFYVYVLK